MHVISLKTEILDQGQTSTDYNMEKFLFCLSLFVGCSAQVPQRCDAPKEWSARRIRMDRHKDYYEAANYSYDEVNMRTRSKEEIAQGKERTFYDVLRLHKTGMEYRQNLLTKQCNVTKLTSPFRPKGVPQDAKFIYEAEVGDPYIPNEHFTSLLFGGTFEDGARYYVQVTSPDCVPISFDVRSNTTDEHFHENYYDFKIGPLDPSTFTPPPECTKVDR